MNNRDLLFVWARQQEELEMPDIVFGLGSFAMESIRHLLVLPSRHSPAPPDARVQPAPFASSTVRAFPPAAGPDYTRLKKLPALSKPVPQGPQAVSSFGAATPDKLTFEQKRTIFKDIYAARCSSCPLSASRKSFVFGAGNVDAPLMIVGEAPGAEEDQQGLPFVGAAGRLLTGLLSAAGIDRKKDVFITNVLKCRPPQNRSPESAEVLACFPLLEKQIAVIAPRVLLLLGRIAAHALLPTQAGISRLRAGQHEYKGVPVVVTYHPAAILRNAEYRRPTEEDFGKTAQLLQESSRHAV